MLLAFASHLVSGGCRGWYYAGRRHGQDDPQIDVSESTSPGEEYGQEPNHPDDSWDELWAQTYPRDFVPPASLANIYIALGQYDKALVEHREAFRLDVASSLTYDNLVSAYLFLNRLEEARATTAEEQAKKLDSPYLHFFLYQVAFLQKDAAGMAQQLAWAAGKPGVEDMLLASEADTAAYSGRLGKARATASPGGIQCPPRSPQTLPHGKSTSARGQAAFSGR